MFRYKYLSQPASYLDVDHIIKENNGRYGNAHDYGSTRLYTDI
jgi:hypothetical protein